MSLLNLNVNMSMKFGLIGFIQEICHMTYVLFLIEYIEHTTSHFPTFFIDHGCHNVLNCLKTFSVTIEGSYSIFLIELVPFQNDISSGV